MVEWESSGETLPMLEIACPEYFVTNIGRVESAGRGNVRVYCCVQKGLAMEPAYTVVVPIESLAVMARYCLKVAADHHNQLMMMLERPRVAH